MAGKNVYQFKISLKGTKPPLKPIWRRILVPETFTFSQFHHAIIDAMAGWNDYHLHQFHVKNTATGEMETIGTQNDYDDFTINENDKKILDYFVAPGTKGQYDYDFGDNWQHAIVLEKVLPATVGVAYPQCVAGRSACPLEDCGGIYGYAHLIDVLANPDDEEYEELANWVKEVHNKDAISFDPNSFNAKQVQFRAFSCDAY